MANCELNLEILKHLKNQKIMSENRTLLNKDKFDYYNERYLSRAVNEYGYNPKWGHLYVLSSKSSSTAKQQSNRIRPGENKNTTIRVEPVRENINKLEELIKKFPEGIIEHYNTALKKLNEKIGKDIPEFIVDNFFKMNIYSSKEELAALEKSFLNIFETKDIESILDWIRITEPRSYNKFVEKVLNDPNFKKESNNHIEWFGENIKESGTSKFKDSYIKSFETWIRHMKSLFENKSDIEEIFKDYNKTIGTKSFERKIPDKSTNQENSEIFQRGEFGLNDSFDKGNRIAEKNNEQYKTNLNELTRENLNNDNSDLFLTETDC